MRIGRNCAEVTVISVHCIECGRDKMVTTFQAVLSVSVKVYGRRAVAAVVFNQEPFCPASVLNMLFYSLLLLVLCCEKAVLCNCQAQCTAL